MRVKIEGERLPASIVYLRCRADGSSAQAFIKIDLVAQTFIRVFVLVCIFFILIYLTPQSIFWRVPLQNISEQRYWKYLLPAADYDTKTANGAKCAFALMLLYVWVYMHTQRRCVCIVIRPPWENPLRTILTASFELKKIYSIFMYRVWECLQ